MFCIDGHTHTDTDTDTHTHTHRHTQTHTDTDTQTHSAHTHTGRCVEEMGNTAGRQSTGSGAVREMSSGTHYFLHLALEAGVLEEMSSSTRQHQQQQQHQGIPNASSSGGTSNTGNNSSKGKGSEAHSASSSGRSAASATSSSSAPPLKRAHRDEGNGSNSNAGSAASSPANSLSRTPSFRSPMPQRSASPSLESMASFVSTSTTKSSVGSLSTSFELFREPVACTGGSFRPGASIDPMRETPYFEVKPHLEEVHLPTSDSHTHVDRVSYFMLESHASSRAQLRKAKIVPPLTADPSFAVVVQGSTYTTTLRREGRAMHVELLKPNGDCIMFARFYTLKGPAGGVSADATSALATSSSSSHAHAQRGRASAGGGTGRLSRSTGILRRLSGSSGSGGTVNAGTPTGGGGDGGGGGVRSRDRHTFEVRTTSEGVMLARGQGHIRSGFDLLVSDFVTADHPMYSVVLGFVVTVLLSKMLARRQRRQRKQRRATAM